MMYVKELVPEAIRKATSKAQPSESEIFKALNQNPKRISHTPLSLIQPASFIDSPKP